MAHTSSTTRRQLFAGSFIAAGAAAAVACGAPSGTGPVPAPKGLSGKVIFYTRGGDVETRGQQEILIPTFKQVAPNVEIVHEVFAGQQGESYTSKLLAMWAAGSPPDVWGFGQNYMGFWARGMVADLTPLINRDKYDLNQFLTGLPDKFKVHGKQYGIPQLTTFGTLLFFNKDLFDKEGIKYPPVDWDDRSWTYEKMLDVAQKLTKNAGSPDATYGLGYFPQKPTMPAWNFGGDAFLPEHYTNGIAPKTNLDSKEAVDGLQFAQDVAWKHHVSIQSGKDPSEGISFKTGRVAIEINGGWNFWGYSTIKDFKWAAAAVPVKVNNKNVAYNDFWELSSQSKNRDAAWAFIKHIASAEVQRQYSELTGTPPTNKGAIDSWYKRYEFLMPRADLEKVTQGAIDPRRSQESPDHLFIEWPQMDSYFGKEINTPLNQNLGTARDLINQAKPGYDSLVKEIYDRWKGKTPA